jgi:chromosome segregation ATPase
MPVTPEHKKAIQKAWYEAHKEELRAKAREYRKKQYKENTEIEKIKNREGHLKRRLKKLNEDLKIVLEEKEKLIPQSAPQSAPQNLPVAPI